MYNSIDSGTFTMVEHPGSEFYGIKIQKGKYADVIVTYGAVSVKEDPANDTAKLSFNWNLTDPGDFEPDELLNNEEFQHYLGDLLQYIITDSLENREAKIGTANTHTKPINK